MMPALAAQLFPIRPIMGLTAPCLPVDCDYAWFRCRRTGAELWAAAHHRAYTDPPDWRECYSLRQEVYRQQVALRQAWQRGDRDTYQRILHILAALHGRLGDPIYTLRTGGTFADHMAVLAWQGADLQQTLLQAVITGLEETP